jgi:hypothetical protein
MQKHYDQQSYVRALGLEYHHNYGGMTVYLWPSERNGSAYDRFIAIEEFTDGSCSVYVNTGESGVRAACVKLRSMVDDGPAKAPAAVKRKRVDHVE